MDAVLVTKDGELGRSPVGPDGRYAIKIERRGLAQLHVVPSSSPGVWQDDVHAEFYELGQTFSAQVELRAC